MNKETEQFYLEHKNKTWELPNFPDKLDEKDADQVVPWILEQMKAGTIGWQEMNMLNVKGGEFVPIGWHHMGQIELERLNNSKYYPNNKCVLCIDDKWTGDDEIKERTPSIRSFFIVDFFATNFKLIEFEQIPPGGVKEIHCDNTNEDQEKILSPIKDRFPLTMSMKEPSKKCDIIVEGFGKVPMKEGKIYFINPYRKKVVVNTSDTETAVHCNIQCIPGTKFGEFVNCITRSYFELEGRMGKDYLRHFKHLAEKGGRPGVMDY